MQILMLVMKMALVWSSRGLKTKKEGHFRVHWVKFDR